MKCRPTRRCLTLLLTVLICGLVGACGQKAGQPEANPNPNTDVQTAAVEAQLQSLYEQVFGDAQQRSAGEYEAVYAFNHPSEVCMRQAGFHYPWQHVDPYAHWTTDGAVTGTWLAPLGGSPVSSAAQQLAPAQRQSLRLEGAVIPADAPSQQPDYQAAQRRCEAATRSPDKPEYPTGAMQLLSSYHDMIDAVNANLSSYSDDYHSCMSQAGYDVANPEALYNLIQRKVPDDPRLIPPAGETGGPAWQALLKAEGSAYSADATCRAVPHDAGLQMVAPRIAQFEKDHAQELADVQAGWNQLVADATGHGWTPPAQ